MLDVIFYFALGWTLMSLSIKLVHHDYDREGGSKIFDGLVWSIIAAFLMFDLL